MPSEPVEYKRLADELVNAKRTIVEKPWGREHIIELGDALLKVITVNLGGRTSLQWHKQKREVITIIQWGTIGGVYTYNDLHVPTRHTEGAVVIEPGTVHRSVGPCTLLELTTLDNDDVVRIEDDYAR